MKIRLERDVLGIRPLWYVHQDGLHYSEDKNELEKKGFINIKELNPRKVLIYDKEKDMIEFKAKRFFSIRPEHKKSFEKIVKELTGLVVNAVARRIPDKKFGILFSGGVDSTLIALICKELGVDFTCYTAAIEDRGMKQAEDLVYSEKAAKELGLKLNVKKVSLKQAEKYLKDVVKLIDEPSVVKAGVGLTLYLACEEARKDGIKFVFSGLGSEEIFAGYERHRISGNVNEECLAGLKQMHERDLYRDYVITKHHKMQLLVPFLDPGLVDYSLKIPGKHKIKNGVSKFILRKVAECLGLNKEFAERKKRAAQYGSRTDRAILRLAKRNGFRYKSDYLRDLLQRNKARIGVLFSSGKDSTYSAYIMMKNHYPVECLINVKSRNPYSYMFHTPGVELVKLQAEAMGLPLVSVESKGEKEKELKDLEEALRIAKNKYKLSGVSTGALYSNYQRERIERICRKLKLKVFSPLWHMNQEDEMREIVDEGFEIIFMSVAAEGLDKGWIGKKIGSEDIDKLVELNKKVGLNIAGEGGEFESLVLDAPCFRKKIVIKKKEIVVEGKHNAKLVVKKAVLKEKKVM